MMDQNDIPARNLTKSLVPIAYRMPVSVMAKIYDSFVGKSIDVVLDRSVFGIVSDYHFKTNTFLLQYGSQALL
jgi:hypothetical protein